MAARRSWEELRAAAAASPLAQLGRVVCERYGNDFEKWLDSATSPLPETLRLNPLRYDVEWTEEALSDLGGQRIGWYSGDGGAMQFPWRRGKPESETTKALMQAVHETGRVTRQEAASMLPILIADPQSGETLLDLCAAPGSKTTQAMVAMRGGGMVVANEPNSRRANMLGSNTNRIGLANLVICRHDGRHFPRVSEPGFDVVIADVPCTGSATMRKNGGLWKRWKPSSASGLQRLQIDIAERGARLLRPGGRMVYSTCSIDVVENEAVVAELMVKCPWLRLADIEAEQFPGLDLQNGFTDWSGPDWTELGRPELDRPGQLGFALEGYEVDLREELNKCRRLPIGGSIDTGGFFVALFNHTGEGEIADALRYDRTMKMTTRDTPPDNEHIPIPLGNDLKTSILARWPLKESDFSWWARGKRIYVGTPLMRDWLHDPQRYGGKGRMWPGKSWHPLQVLHAGVPILEERSGGLRPKSAAMPILRRAVEATAISLSEEQFRHWLEGPGPRQVDLDVGEQTGSVMITAEGRGGKIVVPAWLGELLTPMVDANERLILELQYIRDT
jgi:16S rRNA C967 or C1407 C5-methylase (RsmB/RsmF family)/NOL1/NOP2/fmu family ribosome biogenesis protein